MLTHEYDPAVGPAVESDKRIGMRNKRNATIALVLGTIACLVSGWLLLRGATSLETFPLNTLNPQGEKADIIYDLVVPVFAIAGLVFILVEVGVLWMVYRFRRSDSRPSRG